MISLNPLLIGAYILLGRISLNPLLISAYMLLASCSTMSPTPCSSKLEAEALPISMWKDQRWIGVGYHKPGYPKQKEKSGKKGTRASPEPKCNQHLDRAPGLERNQRHDRAPGLERNQRLARALASSAISASPEPRPRAQSTPRPSLGLGARLLTHSGRTSDATCVMPPTPQQGTSPTILPTPITVAPHLYHCERCATVGGMGGVNPATVSISWLLLFYCCRTDYRASDPTIITIQTGLGNAANRDDHAIAHTIRTRRPISTRSALWLHCTLRINYKLTHVKTLPPLMTIKGEAGHPIGGHEHTTHNTQTNSNPHT